jgi:myo-inositol 2-dehydrogenase/D-chiro-inositol 1-dehydrogenase
MPNNRLRVAWIGCGNHATDNLLPYLRLTRTELIATCDIDKARAEATARTYGATRAYQNYEELLQSEELDALMIAVGPKQHYEITLAALEKGLHVFVEKPPAATAAQAEEIAQVATDKKLHVMVGFMKRFATANLMMQRLISSPEFGKPLSLVCQYMTAPGYFNDCTGFLHHHCVHYADLVRHLMGDIDEVHTRQVALGPTVVLYQINLQFASGALGFLQMGTIQSRGNPVEWIQVMSDGHRVVVDNVTRITHYRPNEQKWPHDAAILNHRSDAVTWEPNLTVAHNQDHKGYANELLHFVDSILNGDAPEPGAQQGAEALRVLEAIGQSAAAGEPISLRKQAEATPGDATV